MKFILVSLNAKFIHSNLAIRSIQKYTQLHTGIMPEIREYTINQPEELILRELFEEHPDIVGFSCYIWNIDMILRLVVQLKQVAPDITIVLGGPEVSYNSKELLESYPVDMVIRGEGEKTFAELVQALQNKVSLDSVKGLTWKIGSQLVENPPQPPLRLDDIPFVYDDERMAQFQNRIIYYESSRGCPYQCAYCLSSIEKGVRLLSEDRVEQDLQFFLNHRVKQVKFVDRSFNCNKHHALHIWKYVAEHDNGITNFHCEINGDTLDEESISFLQTARKGLFQFEIGIQTTNEKTLKEIHRKNNFDRISQVVAALQKNKNIHLHLDLIAGLPHEDYHSFGKSFNDVYALHPDQFQLGFLKLLKGSDLERRQKELGITCRKTAPYEVLFTRWLPFERTLQLKMIEEMVEQYYNSNRFKACIRYLETLFPTPFSLYENLAGFYQKKGYHKVSHTKEQAYTILYEFLMELPKGNLEYFQWLAKFDLYSHEKAKKIPSWIPNDLTTEQKQPIYQFYNQPENIKTYLPDYQNLNGLQIYRMAHLEKFPFHPLTGQRQECYLLFNYRQTDLLGNALVIELPVEQIETEMEN